MSHQNTAKPPQSALPPRRARRGFWPHEAQRFSDRTSAGEALGSTVADRMAQNDERPLVLGLARGGIVVAREIAKRIDADLDVIVTRRVGLPWAPGCAVGAIADEGPAVFDHSALASARTGAEAVTAAIRSERKELRRRRDLYRGDRPLPAIAGRTVIVADDGLTAGVLTRAAVRAVRAQGPARLLYAAPVCAAEAADWLRTETDAIIHLHSPRVFHALGLWYRDATPVTDSDAARILELVWKKPGDSGG